MAPIISTQGLNKTTPRAMSPWTAWNHVRTIASLAAATAFSLALFTA